MPRVDLLTVDGQKSARIDLPARIFAAKINELLMAQAVRVYLTNQRKAKAKVKRRGEVKGSGRKIWRQKGTGRARHGDRYAPIFVGGGVTYGPQANRSYRLKMAKKMKRAALFSALTSKLKAKEILVVAGLPKVKPKTAEIRKLLTKLKVKAAKDRVLLVVPKKIDKLLQASRNLENFNLIQADLLNTYQILQADKLILMKEAVKRLEEKWI